MGVMSSVLSEVMTGVLTAVMGAGDSSDHSGSESLYLIDDTLVNYLLLDDVTMDRLIVEG